MVHHTTLFFSCKQVQLVKTGKPYVMFGDGQLASCKPISEADLASFMADCVKDPSKANQMLPIGGKTTFHWFASLCHLREHLARCRPTDWPSTFYPEAIGY